MTDNGNADTIGDLFRSLGGVLNNIIYFLLGIMYQIFFNVASAQLFESETIKNFYGRIQLIIGVFMVFKLAVSILQGIMNPEQFSNPKEGFGNFITRVVVALALLTVLVPINVPDVQNANSFEKYINNNGLLFGTLYSLQERILSNNTLGRLILGTTDQATTSSSSSDTSGMTESEKQTAMLERSSRIFASTILKGFLRINLLPPEVRESDDETDKDNWYCGGNLSETAATALEAYQQLDIDPSSLLSGEILTVDCEINDGILQTIANGASNIPLIGGLFETFGGKSRYVFAFQWLGAFIVGIVFLVILVGFTVDIAIRSIKLAILRLIAPIPVISYIEPKSSKDGGMFSSWVKALTSTYLDLFLRLAIVYFVIFLIQDMIVNGVVINEADGMVGIISFIFIMLGLFFFAKMAPKFIKDALGLKGVGMSNIGLSGILGGAAMVAGGGGLAGFAMGAMQGTDAAVKGQVEGKPMPLGAAWSQNRDLMAKIRTGDKDAHGGFGGKILDHLNFRVRDNAASRLGLSDANVNKAKNNMIAAQNDLAHAQDELNQYDENVRNGVVPYNAGDRQSLLDAIRNKQQIADDAQRAYQKGDDARTKQFGVSDRPIDRWGVSDRTTLAERGAYNREANARHGGYVARRIDNGKRIINNAKTAVHNAGEFVKSGNGYFKEANYDEYTSRDTFKNSRAYPANGGDPGHLDDDFSDPGMPGGGPGGPPPH